MKRSSGIILHPTSLPGKYGIGDLGRGAYKFVDILAEAGQGLWQVLPLGHTGYGDSPYQCFSAFAGNPFLINLEGFKDVPEPPEPEEKFDDHRVEYGRVINYKYAVLRNAFKDFKKFNDPFFKKNASWLDGYSLYMALKDHFGGKDWGQWDSDIKLREPGAVASYSKKLEAEVNFYKFLQYEFFKQWGKLKTYANSKGIKIIGDIPIFVSFDSSDAWANPDLFYFDSDLKPIKVAGVPPDYFSQTGQLWGNPLYNWKALKKTGYKWWVERIRTTRELFDIIRIDHFMGFESYWAIPYGSTTAVDGIWEKGPGKAVFEAINKSLGKVPFVAEDLGLITPAVKRLRNSLGFPGMKILQFAFESLNEEDDYLPHRYKPDCVVYTGTHDNDTTAGWYERSSEQVKEFTKKYLNSDGKDIVWDIIKAAWTSKAVMALVPLQDILSLNSDARMNTPSVASGNWQWRFTFEQLTPEIKSRLKDLTKKCGRGL